MTKNEDVPQSVEELENRLSEPDEKVTQTLRRLSGDIMVLGAGGKMGPMLARMARRASESAGVQRRVIGVSRFSDASVRRRLESHGVETIAGDLLDERFIQSLPAVPNVVYMAGLKFGVSQTPSIAWAMNCYVPALVCRTFRESRIVAFSTGNVYGMVNVDRDGSRETDELKPVGEYAMACLGRERIFEYFSRSLDIPLALLRLNYATEMRYGILVDLAQQVWANESVDVSMGYFNVIWQGDATAMALRSFDHVATPPQVLNIAGPEKLQVRTVCKSIARLLDKPVGFSGSESADAFLSDSRRADQLLGHPTTSADDLIAWTAEWIRRGGWTLGKPTKFQCRDGKY